MKYIKKYYIWIIFTLCLLLFILIASLVMMNQELSTDTAIYSFISSHLIKESRTEIVKVLTNLGSARILFVIVLVSLVLFKNKILALCMGLNLLLSSNINFFLKRIFMRTRPIGINIITEKGYSFPSGHSMTSACFYGFLIYLTYKYVKNKNLKIVLIILESFVILAVGISRIYLGVHYATDVLGGFIFALIYLILFIKLLRFYKILD